MIFCRLKGLLFFLLWWDLETKVNNRVRSTQKEEEEASLNNKLINSQDFLK